MGRREPFGKTHHPTLVDRFGVRPSRLAGEHGRDAVLARQGDVDHKVMAG